MAEPTSSPAAAPPARPISRFPVPSLDAVPDDIRARILEVQEQAGFVPNVYLAFGHRPAEIRAFFADHDALLLREPGGPGKRAQAMLLVAPRGIHHGCTG